MSELASSDLTTMTATQGASPGTLAGEPFLKVYNGFGQTQADVAVIMPSMWRSTLKQALRSVIEQDFSGKIQIMLGFDTANPTGIDLEALIGDLPANRSVTAFYPGYSTSQRRGGVHVGYDGGALRVLLCYLANSRRVAFLDDDNWYAPQHINILVEAMGQDVGWAFTLRWFVDPRNDAVVCVDDWESTGPDAGVYLPTFGGFVDPNCLMYDKILCDQATRYWAIPMSGDGTFLTTDRQVFYQLKTNFAWRAVPEPTVYYRMNLTDPVQEDRLKVIQLRGISIAP